MNCRESRIRIDSGSKRPVRIRHRKYGVIVLDTKTDQAVEDEELATLKRLALETDESQTVAISRSGLADRLAISPRTIARRLRRLEGKDLLDRDFDGDGQVVSLTPVGIVALCRKYEQYRRTFDADETTGIEYSGSVSTGMGDGQWFVSLDGYAKQFRERLGYELFPGTLNVELNETSVRRRPAL